MMGPDARLTGRAVWETLTFLLNGAVFIITGLEVPLLVRALSPAAAITMIGTGIAVSVALLAVRALWVFATALLTPWARGEPRPPRMFAYSLVISWAGMRGVVSLAAALALPPLLPAGGPVSTRDAVLVVTLTVIVFTLVGQGLTLPWFIRRLRLDTDAGPRTEEASARRQLVEAATRRIDELYPVWPTHHPLLDRLRATYEHDTEHIDRQRDASGSGESDREIIEHREIVRTVINSEREALLRLRADDAIDDDVMRALERELDLEERRLDP